MDPVLPHQVSQQWIDAHGDRPEVSHDCSGERAMYCREQFTHHHKPWHKHSLTTNRDDSERYLFIYLFFYLT